MRKEMYRIRITNATQEDRCSDERNASACTAGSQEYYLAPFGHSQNHPRPGNDLLSGGICCGAARVPPLGDGLLALTQLARGGVERGVPDKGVASITRARVATPILQSLRVVLQDYTIAVKPILVALVWVGISDRPCRVWERVHVVAWCRLSCAL